MSDALKPTKPGEWWFKPVGRDAFVATVGMAWPLDKTAATEELCLKSDYARSCPVGEVTGRWLGEAVPPKTLEEAGLYHEAYTVRDSDEEGHWYSQRNSNVTLVVRNVWTPDQLEAIAADMRQRGNGTEVTP